MCEANVFIIKDNKEQLIMEGAFIIKKDGDTWYFQNIFGEQEIVKGNVKEIDLIAHKITIFPISD